jgi:hypothetical protein
MPPPKVTPIFPATEKLERLPHRGQGPVKSVVSGGVSGFGPGFSQSLKRERENGTVRPSLRAVSVGT